MKINNDYIVKNINSDSRNINNINNSSDFKQILDNKINNKEEILFSKHANKRLSTRDISITKEQMNRVEKGIENAKEKGIKDTLVLVDNIALVVNIKNNVVITAMTKNNESVFTNIDGAVIV